MGGSITDFKEFADANHYIMGQPAWKEKAEFGANWLKRDVRFWWGRSKGRQLAGIFGLVPLLSHPKADASHFIAACHKAQNRANAGAVFG